jgi:hypothetical protein
MSEYSEVDLVALINGYQSILERETRPAVIALLEKRINQLSIQLKNVLDQI